MIDELKPCPKCKVKPFYRLLSEECAYGGSGSITCTLEVEVKCLICGVSITTRTTPENKDEAVENWNRFAREVETTTLEINHEMTAVYCDKCGYELPKGTDLMEVKECPSCKRKVVDW